jgi:hypothetical protein
MELFLICLKVGFYYKWVCSPYGLVPHMSPSCSSL